MGPAAREYEPGTIIPGSKYRVVHRLGGGGMATVYDVVDTSVDRAFVLKVLHPQLGDNEDLARRLLKEARILGRLHHTNIVEVITAGVTEDDLHLPYYVMEKLNGQSIRVILEKKGQIDLPHAVHIAIDLLDALDHAHDAGVIHRDVKPDNIVLHKTPANLTVTKLLDFGIVSVLDGGKRETAGRFLGTLRYAAPEQLQGKDPTRKMDVYCAALVLYEMAAGRGPFDDLRDSTAIARAHIDRKAPRVSQFVVVPDELDRLLAAALDKDPEKRPRDAYSFAASLRNLKRTLGPSPDGFESLGSKSTALAALDLRPQPAAAVVEVQQAAPGGQYVVSPGPPVAVPVPEPRTTMRGMSAPPGAAPSQAITTKGELESVDRGAATNTSAEPPPTPPVGSTLRISAPAPVEIDAPILWPPEKPPAQSDEAQIRSIPVASPAQSSRVVVIALTTVVGLGLATSALLLLRHASDQGTAPAAAASVVAPPPQPEPVVTVPAPTIAPPALEDIPAPSTSPSASASAVSAPTGKPPPPKPKAIETSKPSATSAPVPAPRPAPASAPVPPDRPGPGF